MAYIKKNMLPQFNLWEYQLKNDTLLNDIFRDSTSGNMIIFDKSSFW